MNLERNRRKCGGCEESEPAIIHSVSERGVSRRFCTDCLLRNSKQLFCPVCLYLFDEVPPPNARLMCLNCPSITHLSCSPPSSDTSAATAAPVSSSSSSSACFTCPPCSDPNFSFFPKSQSSSSENNTGEKDGSETTLDVASIKALVAAANIAAISMTKAASLAKMEADKKVQEAILAKKRAKEALEHVQSLVNKKIKSGNSNKKKTPDI